MFTSLVVVLRHGDLAQWSEREGTNLKVTGSNPVVAIFCGKWISYYKNINPSIKSNWHHQYPRLYGSNVPYVKKLHQSLPYRLQASTLDVEKGLLK